MPKYIGISAYGYSPALVVNFKRKFTNQGVIVNTANTVSPDETELYSFQAELIRQIQTNDGQVACYATSASNQCDNKDCGWRHDCVDEAREHGK